MSNKLQLLVSSRKYTRKLVTECYNRKSDLASLSSVEKSQSKTQLESYLQTLKGLNEQIQLLKWEDEQNETWLKTELESCEDYFRKIRECLALTENATPSCTPVETARSLLKSPTAPLPVFKSEEGEDLLKFFTDFEDITSLFNYSSYDKFILLKQQISGRALLLLQSLESDKRGYDHAKELLTKALASRDTQIFNVIERLSAIKLDHYTDPFEYVSQMRNITETVERLELDKDSFLRFFFWQGLNESFKAHLTQITNSSKPTLAQINDNFFEAADRYKGAQSKRSKSYAGSRYTFDSRKNVSSAAAVNVNYSREKASFKPCSLCTKIEGKEAAHPIFKCDKFVSASDKVNKLKNFNGCVRCAGLSHVTDKCRFRLNSKCKHCNEWHFSFLCIKSEGKENTKEPKTPKVSCKETNNTIGVTEALKSNLDYDNSILPTFSCTAENGLKLRVLKDGGCQSNFIKESIAETLNLKVLQDNVNLTVTGINVAQNYVTKLVEITVHLGSKRVTLEALCIPEIKINLKLPGLGKLVKGLTERGYVLADKLLLANGDIIDNLDFILGTKSGYCLPESEFVFGREDKSVLSETACGVMLKGDIDNLILDLEYLPFVGIRANVNCAEVEKDDHPEGHALSQASLISDENSLSSTTESTYALPLSTHFDILDDQGKLNCSQLQKAVDDILYSSGDFYSCLDQYEEGDTSELNKQLIKYTLDNAARDKEGRLLMPLMWNASVSHLLGGNKQLSKLILKSNLKKLKKNKAHLELMDQTFKEQEEAGIIERIDNIDKFSEEHPNISFLPHMGVFKLDRDTTKCRVVFLSNLCEKDPSKPLTVSHNQAIHSGPCLNQKIASALLHLRFDSQLLCFDLCKAFNQISLSEVDANRLLFLWYRNVAKGDFTLVGYRNVRLSFGLRCSPAILLLGLYKILILDAEHDPLKLKHLKAQIYSLCYMDNCAISMNDLAELKWSYNQLESIFEPYKFSLQQFVTNNQELQSEIDLNLENKTPDKVKLLGIQWDRIADTLSTKPINLNLDAHTKREVLSTIASQFDLYYFNGPVLNRSRIFLHSLQCNQTLGWDDKLPPDQLNEWRNIARQANATPEIKVKRFVGKRGGSFKLLAFADSSKLMYGVVVYILDVETNELSFILAKNRIVSKQLENKSIPALELQGISLATECLIDLHKELSGPMCVNPINVVDLKVFSDSLVALTWINSYTHKMSKMQKRSVFVMNRIDHINRLCEMHPVKFSFISGLENPADAITRCLSYRRLMQTTYFSGPSFLRIEDEPNFKDVLSFVVPNPLSTTEVSEEHNNTCNMIASCRGSEKVSLEHLIPTDRYSSFHKLVSVYCKVLTFIKLIKSKLKARDPVKYGHLNTDCDNLYAEASKHVIRMDQHQYFAEVLEYFQSENKVAKSLPNLVGQLNIYLDEDGLLRVRSKCEKLKSQGSTYNFPILLAKHSKLTSLIILSLHKKLAHAGCYVLLAEMRKRFYVPHFFSVVKKILKSCVGCRRFNERTIKLNQSPYREWRINPPNVPYKYIFMDYLGPLWVKQCGKKTKVWLLCITCMWSRAVNLKICPDLSTKNFLRAFQMHCFEYGIAEYCISDLGSQLVSASNIICDYLKDHETQTYFQENGVKSIKFENFAKGHSELGSMVEVCVKMTKRLLFGAIGNNVLDLRDFEFLVSQTVHLINRRPIAFKEALRDTISDDVPEPITPESLIRGYNLISVNVIPELHGDPEQDWQPNKEYQAEIKSEYAKLQRVRSKLINLYKEEFLANLVYQAVNVKDRYKPVRHKVINPGDIVLLKEEYMKPSHFPMGLVKTVEVNSIGEVTNAMILKGGTKELVKRHSSVIIPLLTFQEDESVAQPKFDNVICNEKTFSNKQQRKAAVKSAKLTKIMLRD